MKHYSGKQIKDEFFSISMFDLEEGMSIDDLRALLDDYANRELYWECAGIQKAIEYMGFMLLTLMSNKLNTKEINLEYANTEKETTRKRG
tara:strand:- start:2452 stop:2721 length:270 start_codon:yes stop_codon:yes gene_type:complete